VFCKKRPQAIENKRVEHKKERKERTRAAKLLRIRDLRVATTPEDREYSDKGLAGLKRKEKPIESVDEGMVVGAGLRVLLPFGSASFIRRGDRFSRAAEQKSG
jgi:hypothetical protein